VALYLPGVALARADGGPGLVRPAD
jgi:hypothetical protein